MKIRIRRLKREAVSDEDETVTSGAPTVPSGNEVEQAPAEILKNRGFELTSLLGQGKFGKVYSAFDNNDREVAIKVISFDVQGGESSVDKEISNYVTIQKAREKSDLVAKHFPELYGKPFKEGKYGFIVMEMLTSGGDESLEISDLFQGAEGVISPHQDLVAHGAYKDLSRRLFAFFDDTGRRNAFVEGLFKGLDIESIQHEPTKRDLQDALSKMKGEADLWRGRFDAVKDEDKRQVYMQQVMKLENLVPFQHQSLIMDFDTKKELTDNLWLYYTFLKMLEILKNTIDEYVYESYVGTVTENFIELIRKGSPIPVHNRPEKRRAHTGGASDEMAGVSEQARSLKAALEEAEKLTGLAARDMHDKNAMFRPLGGDIVIVDLGLFKPRTEVREGKKWSQKQRNKRKKNCANPKGFTMKQFCKNQKTKSKKGERKNEGLERKTISIKIKRDLEERCQKGYKTHPKRKTKKMFGRTYRNCVKAENKEAEGEIEEVVYSDKQRRYMCAMADHGADRPEGLTKKEAGKKCKGPMKEADPKKGTGKKPKGSGRRLYTDEDPSDTVSVSFKSVSAIKKTLAKSSFKSKSHKRQSQIINLIHQRSRAAYKNAKDPKVKARLKKAFDYATKRKEASKKKTIQKRKNKK